MAEIDVMRTMASEHDLEFIDLTNFGVDPAAAGILNEEVARRLHVVAIKRKFGTPVVATAEPDDLVAHDSVRAALGRDFISVVATHDQIGDYLDRMFPPEPKPEGSGGKRSRRKRKTEPAEETPVEKSASTLAGDFFSAERVLSEAEASRSAGPTGDAAADVDNTDVDADPDSDVVASDPAHEATVTDGTDDDAAPDPEEAGQWSVTAEQVAVDGEDLGGADLNGHGPVDDVSALEPTSGDETDVVDLDSATEVGVLATSVDPDLGEETVPGEGDGSGEPQVDAVGDDDGESEIVGVAEEVSAPPLEVEEEISVEDGGAEPTEVKEVDGKGATPVASVLADSEASAGLSTGEGFDDDVPDGGSLAPEPQAEEPDFGALVDELQSAVPALDVNDDEGESSEPQLPAFDTSAFVAADVGGESATGDMDELAGLADSIQQATAGAGSSDRAADLVDEAVASYEEHHVGRDDDGAGDLGILEGLPALARILVQGGRVPLDQMQEALVEHDRSGQSIARILSARKLVTEADLMWGMATELGLEFVDLDLVGISFTDAGTIPEATARHHNVLVIGNEDGVPVVATANPTDVFAMDDLRTIMRKEFRLVVAAPTQITEFIGRVFDTGGGDAVNVAMEASLDIDGVNESSVVDDIQAVTEEAPIVRYVNLLILQALNERASDIHVEPSENELRIRYRIDGVLHDVSTAPRSIAPAVITRLKVMADLNVAEHRIPQDGRISLNVGAKGIDLRVATLPTIHGEKIVMRVLDKSAVVLGFADLGFPEDLLERYEAVYTKPYGTILVTGPTGSGKSTTLYTTLTALNNPEKNIITVEDPVELQLKGVNQVQLNLKAGLTFASALKSILRSDPDIVLVGEIRDQETAVIAIEAALTGHMVLSTLHTNSAAATPMRLIEMGIEPFLVTSSLSAVLAQRLTRRLCLHCKETKEITEADIVAAGWTVEELEALGGVFKTHVAVGCSACANTGYRGRMALSELMTMTEEIERCIIEGGSVDDIHRLAVGQGMQTLRQSGLRKAIEGETTLEEVLRVVA